MTILFGMTQEEFRAIRKRLGLTQAQLADVLGYGGVMSISIMERKSNPQPIPRRLMMLMRALDAGYRPPNWPRKIDEPAADARTGGQGTGDRGGHARLDAPVGRNSLHQHRSRKEA